MTGKKKQVTKRQHWIPKSYLEKFTSENGKVKTYWFTDVGRAEFWKTAEKKEIAPIDLTVKIDLYETPILPTNAIEETLSNIEAAYNKILRKKIEQGITLTEYEHEVVAYFVGSLEYRTLAQKDHINGFVDQLEEKGRSLALAHSAPEAAETWSEEMAQMKEHMFAQGVVAALDVNKWGPLDFCFLSPEDYVDIKFITSDHPVSLIDFTRSNQPVGANHWSKTAECVVPLTPEIALLGNCCGITGYRKVDYNFVREINHRVLSHADKLVMANVEIDDSEGRAIVKRIPQSILLKYIALPSGRFEEILKAIDDKESSSDDSSIIGEKGLL